MVVVEVFFDIKHFSMDIEFVIARMRISMRTTRMMMMWMTMGILRSDASLLTAPI